jgi:hypothetical protein
VFSAVAAAAIWSLCTTGLLLLLLLTLLALVTGHVAVEQHICLQQWHYTGCSLDITHPETASDAFAAGFQHCRLVCAVADFVAAAEEVGAALQAPVDAVADGIAIVVAIANAG